jgi:hypothetical protein
VKEYKLKTVDISALKAAPYNPSRRCGNNKQMTGLIKSIEEIGLVYPVAVTPKNEVIDGHRRIEACKRLGWTEIPVIVVVGERDKIYGEVNAKAAKFNGNDMLRIYLERPEALTPSIRKFHQRAEDAVGRDLLKRIANSGSSLRVYGMAKQIAAYCENSTPSFVVLATRWMLNHKSLKALIAAYHTQTPPRVIERAIKQNKRLNVKYTSAL